MGYRRTSDRSKRWVKRSVNWWINALLPSIIWLGGAGFYAYLKKPAGVSVLEVRTDAPGWLGAGLLGAGFALHCWSTVVLAGHGSARGQAATLAVTGPTGLCETQFTWQALPFSRASGYCTGRGMPTTSSCPSSCSCIFIWRSFASRSLHFAASLARATALTVGACPGGCRDWHPVRGPPNKAMQLTALRAAADCGRHAERCTSRFSRWVLLNAAVSTNRSRRIGLHLATDRY